MTSPSLDPHGVRSYRWLVLGAATTAQATSCFLMQGLGALAPQMQSALDLSALEVGALISATQTITIVGLLAAGELLDRFSERAVVGVGAFLVAAALAAASLCNDYRSLLAWLLVVGGGYSTAQPGGSKSVAKWFPESQRGLAMGIRQAGLPLGGACATAILPVVASHHGWQAAFRVGAGVAVAGGLAFVAVYRSPSIARSRAVTSVKDAVAGRLQLLRHPRMRNIIWSGITLITVQYAVLGFFILYLMDRFHLPADRCVMLLFVAQMSGVIGRIGLAWWSDRTKSSRYLPVVVSMVALSVGLAGLLVLRQPTLVSLLPLAAWLGLFGFGWYGPWVAYVSESAPPDRVGFALGLAMSVNQVAIVASPLLLGWSRDATGSYAVDWWLLIIALVLAALVTGRSRGRSAEGSRNPDGR